MSNPQIILIFFRLLNFAVLIGIFWYLWYRFGKPYLQAEYDVQIGHLDTLSRTHTVLRKEHSYIKKLIRAEDEDRAVLKERLFVWREAVGKEHEAMEVALDERRKKLDSSLKEQIARVSEYRMYTTVRGEALQELKQKLTKQFATEQSQERFISSLLKRMDTV